MAYNSWVIVNDKFSLFMSHGVILAGHNAMGSEHFSLYIMQIFMSEKLKTTRKEKTQEEKLRISPPYMQRQEGP